MWLLPLKIRLIIVGDYCFTGWRALMIINLLPGVISCIMLYYLPESPKYYLSINEQEKAMEVLEKCCRYNKGKMSPSRVWALNLYRSHDFVVVHS